MEKKEQIFRTAAFKNGSYSVGMTALVIGIVIVINMIAGQLPESVRRLDISDNRIYEITDTSRKILRDMDKEIKFTVFAKKDKTDERIKTFIGKYAGLSDKISVDWVDPVLHPARLKEKNAEADSILISCEKTEKSTFVPFRKILVANEFGYYATGQASVTKFDGEGQFTSALNYVTSDAVKKIYYTTGHGEKTFSTAVSELLEKNNMKAAEVNLLMKNEIPDDCDLLFLYAPAADLAEDEKKLVLSYMKTGGKVFVMLGENPKEMPNLKAVMEEYGIRQADGYIADMQRNYQGNYYYIFPEVKTAGGFTEGLASKMVLLVNARGLTVGDAPRDTVKVTKFMTTSSDAFAVSEGNQEQGTYVLGAVATEVTSENTSGKKSEVSESTEEKTGDRLESEKTEKKKESRLTIVSADSMIDSQITDNLSSLDNLKLFMNTISANFDDVQNVAVEPKNLAVTYNTMRHAGMLSLVVIFGMPMAILVFGFAGWWKRRKA